MRRVLALALGLCLCASPALAFTLTFSNFGDNSTGSVHSVASGNMTVSAGSLVFVDGDMLQMNASTDAVSVTDGAGNSYTVYQCPETAGSTNVSFVAWSVLTNALSAQPVTVADTTNAGTNIGAGGGISFLTWVISGAKATSPEDTAARACNGSTTSTVSPTVTSGTPSQSGDFLFYNYISPTNGSGFSYTVDSAHGWASNGACSSGSARQTVCSDSQTNAGSGTKISNPTTQSAPYASQIIAFLPPTSGSYGGGTTVGVGH